jgi:hypothetical protein
MKALLLSTLVGMFHCAASAQSALEPCPTVQPNPYYDGVNRVIDNSVGRPSSLHLTSLPSFEAESGLRLVGTEVYFVQFRTQFWSESVYPQRDGSYRMNFTKPNIITRVHHAPLSPAIMKRVLDVYARAASTAKKQDSIGIDGVTYLILTPGIACALAWSPDPKTANGRLITLMQRLEIHATLSAPRQLQHSERDIAKLLNVLEND